MNAIDHTTSSFQHYDNYNNMALTMRLLHELSNLYARYQASRRLRRRLCQELDRREPESRAAAAKTVSGSIGIFAWLEQRSNLGHEVSISFVSGVKVPSVEVTTSSIAKTSRSRGE